MTAFRDALQPVLPDDSAQAALAGRVWRPDAAGPAVVAVRDGDLLDISASFPTMRDLCESDAPADRLRAATRRAHRQAGRRAGQHATRRTRPRQAVAARADRSAGHQGRRGDLRGVDDRARDRGTRARRPERRRGDPRRGEPAGGRRPCAAEARVGGGGTSEAGADRAGCVEPVSGSGHRPRRGDLHQGAADGRGRHRHGCGDPSELVVEQPGARGGAGRVLDRPHRRRDLGQRREPARRGGTFRTAARQGEGQQRVLRDRSVPALLRCALHAGRHPADDGFVERRRDRSLPDGRRVIDREDQPRSRRSGGADGEPASPLSGWRGAVPRHHVRAGGGSRCAGQGLHAQDRRHRDDRRTEAGAAGEPDDADGSVRGVELRGGSADAQSRGTGVARSRAVIARRQRRRSNLGH